MNINTKKSKYSSYQNQSTDIYTHIDLKKHNQRSSDNNNSTSNIPNKQQNVQQNQKGVKMKLRDYMKLSQISKRSNSRNSSINHEANRQPSNDKINNYQNRQVEIVTRQKYTKYSPEQLKNSTIYRETPKDMMKQEIKKQITKLQNKLNSISYQIERPLDSKNDQNQQLAILCKIQSILQQQIGPSLQIASRAINKIRNTKDISNFITDAKNFISETPDPTISSYNQRHKKYQMSPLKKLKYSQQKKQKGLSSRQIQQLINKHKKDRISQSKQNN